jgi:hypothetical protein
VTTARSTARPSRVAMTAPTMPSRLVPIITGATTTARNTNGSSVPRFRARRLGPWRSRAEASPCRTRRREAGIGSTIRVGKSGLRGKSITELAEQEGVTDAYVCRVLSLTCFAPGIVEATLDGRQPMGLRLADVLGNGPFAWNAQGRPGASAIDTKLLREVRSRGRTVGSIAETDRGQLESQPACPVYARKQPCWRGDVGRQVLAHERTKSSRLIQGVSGCSLPGRAQLPNTLFPNHRRVPQHLRQPQLLRLLPIEDRLKNVAGAAALAWHTFCLNRRSGGSLHSSSTCRSLALIAAAVAIGHSGGSGARRCQGGARTPCNTASASSSSPVSISNFTKCSCR